MKLDKKSIHGLRGALWLYWYFVRAGALTFGSGGVLLVMQIKRDFSEKRDWLAEHEVWDYYSVGRTLPGLMVSDVVCMFGYRLCGAAGAVSAVLGSATVPLLSIILVVLFYEQFHSNYWIAAVLERCSRRRCLWQRDLIPAAFAMYSQRCVCIFTVLESVPFRRSCCRPPAAPSSGAWAATEPEREMTDDNIFAAVSFLFENRFYQL